MTTGRRYLGSVKETVEPDQRVMVETAYAVAYKDEDWAWKVAVRAAESPTSMISGSSMSGDGANRLQLLHDYTSQLRHGGPFVRQTVKYDDTAYVEWQRALDGAICYTHVSEDGGSQFIVHTPPSDVRSTAAHKWVLPISDIVAQHIFCQGTVDISQGLAIISVYDLGDW